MLITKKKLIELIETKNSDIYTTLGETEIVLIDDWVKESEYKPKDYVAYILRFMKDSPYYECSAHYVRHRGDDLIDDLRNHAIENNITFGDHESSIQDFQDDLHFYRNIAEDKYRYMCHVRDNPNFNLSQKQKEIFDKAISDYSKICQDALNNGIHLDFTEEKTPIHKIYKSEENKEYNKIYKIFYDLSKVIGDAFVTSKFYEQVDLQVLADETKTYNEEYEKALKESPEYNRVETYKTNGIELG